MLRRLRSHPRSLVRQGRCCSRSIPISTCPTRWNGMFLSSKNWAKSKACPLPILVRRVVDFCKRLIYPPRTRVSATQLWWGIPPHRTTVHSRFNFSAGSRAVFRFFLPTLGRTPLTMARWELMGLAVTSFLGLPPIRTADPRTSICAIRFQQRLPTTYQFQRRTWLAMQFCEVGRLRAWYKHGRPRRSMSTTIASRPFSELRRKSAPTSLRGSPCTFTVHNIRVESPSTRQLLRRRQRIRRQDFLSGRETWGETRCEDSAQRSGISPCIAIFPFMKH